MRRNVVKPLVLVAAAALVDGRGRVLVAERPMGKSMPGLWEFPGGKVGPGEAPEQALLRELAEELGLTVARKDLVSLAFASHEYPDFHLLMPLYLCRRWSGAPRPKEGQKILWVTLAELRGLAMPPADRPLVEALDNWRRGRSKRA
jgi:8-oxo-dGTP diphosphatase